MRNVNKERVKDVTHLVVRGTAAVDAVEIHQTGFIHTVHSEHTHFGEVSWRREVFSLNLSVYCQTTAAVRLPVSGPVYFRLSSK